MYSLWFNLIKNNNWRIGNNIITKDITIIIINRGIINMIMIIASPIYRKLAIVKFSMTGNIMSRSS